MKNQIIKLNGFSYRVYNVTESAIHAIKQNSKGDLAINKSNLLTLTNSQIELICKLKKMENVIGGKEMREIKFRAFDFKSQDMLFVKALRLNINHVICKSKELLGNDVYLGYNEIALMQFTGLKDKNGNDIYEGDILKWKCSKSGSKTNKLYVVVIDFQWHSYNLTIHDNGEKWATGNSFWNEKDREIIGNIHEHKHLIDGSI